MKKCKFCGIEKDIEEFSIKKGKINYYTSNRCKKCARELATLKRTPTIICSRCRGIKELNKSPWCIKCHKSYTDAKKINDDIQPKLAREQIQTFVDTILKNDMRVSLNDINDIITNYMSITKRYTEFDNYSPGLQVIKMFAKLMKYVYKKDK